MNKNDESLISHALKLYGVQYDDNIKLKYYWKSYSQFIEVGDRNIWDSYMLRVYNGTGDMSNACDRSPSSSSSDLDINIRSFINHWMKYFNFNKQITHVAVCKCYHNTFDIKILCDDNRLYYVSLNEYRVVDDWIVYNW